MLCEFLIIEGIFIFIIFFFSGEIVSKPIPPSTENYKTKLNVQTNIREGLQEYKNTKNLSRQSSKTSISTDTTHVQT